MLADDFAVGVKLKIGRLFWVMNLPRLALYRTVHSHGYLYNSLEMSHIVIDEYERLKLCSFAYSAEIPRDKTLLNEVSFVVRYILISFIADILPLHMSNLHPQQV